MMVLSIDSSHWAMLLGTVTLTCWIAAGLAAVFGTPEEIRHGNPSRASGYVTTGLTGVGITSAAAMIAILAFA